MINLNIENISKKGLVSESLDSTKPAFDGFVKYMKTNSFLLPKNAGVYFIHDFRGVIYVGETSNLRSRFLQHLNNEENKMLKKLVMHPCGELKFYWIQMPNKFRAVKVQKDWIRYFRPITNQILYTTNQEEKCQ